MKITVASLHVENMIHFPTIQPQRVQFFLQICTGLRLTTANPRRVELISSDQGPANK